MMTEAHMKLIACSNQCTPYSFFDEIYAQRRQPDFGSPPSPWRFEISRWQFRHAANRDMVPVGFPEEETDDREWEQIIVPSVWQSFGYGQPADLQYDLEVAEQQKKSSFLKRKLAAISSDYKDDDIGIYRAWIEIPEHFSDRSVYLLIGGICGRFEVYLNGTQITESDPVYSPKKILLSGSLSAGRNLLTLLVFRFESVSSGLGHFDNGTFGLSGIFRSVSIVADPLVEVRSISVKTRRSGHSVGEDSVIEVFTRLYNHTDIPVPVRLDYQLIEVREEYDIYNLPEVRLRTGEPGETVIEALKSETVKGDLLARGISLWSHATPSLYDLVITVKDTTNRVIGVQKRRIGFRTVSESSRKVFVNDCYVPIRATRYFTFDPSTGLAVPPERLLQDVILMKRAGLNTVLMPHFPADPLFFDLCDRYGLYVICPLDRKDPSASAQSFSSHPSVIIWSMKLDSRDEELSEKIRDAIGSDSGSGLFYYLYRDTGTVSDFDPFADQTGELFGEWQDICADRGIFGRNLPNPILLSTGEGGSPLKYIHQADLCKGYRGAEIAIAQGIVDAFRDKHPKYNVVSEQCETVSVLISGDQPGRPVVINTDLHGPTGELNLEWSLVFAGKELRSGAGRIGIIPPGEEVAFETGIRTDSIVSLCAELGKDPVSCGKEAVPGDLLMNVRVVLANPGPYSPAGYEVAFAQSAVLSGDMSVINPEKPSEERTTPRSDGSESLSERIEPTAETETSDETVRIHEEGTDIHIEFGHAKACFSRVRGGLTRLVVGDHELFSGSTEPAFYRAAANSERFYVPIRIRPKLFTRKRLWRNIQDKIRLKSVEHRSEEDSVIITARYISSAIKGPIQLQYRFDPDSVFSIGMSFHSRVKPLRYGLHMSVPPESDLFEWYGYAPTGTVDGGRRTRLGLYQAKSTDLFHHFARPQENGANRDVRVLDVIASDDHRVRIRRKDQPLFSFAATQYRPQIIDDSRHDELLPVPNGAELFLDFDYAEPSENHPQVKLPGGMRHYSGEFLFEVSVHGTEAT